MAETDDDTDQAGRTSRADDVYARLRSAITAGRVRPNQRLIETELAEQLAVSRTPIREALQRLAAESLLVPARRGWQVRAFSLDEVREIYEVLAPLEGYATRLATLRASDQEVKELVELNASLEEAARDPRQLVEMNNRFHDAVAAMAKNERLAHELYRNRQFYFNNIIAPLYSDDETSEALHHHREIVDALVERDHEAAERVAREHVMSGLDKALDKLQQLGEGDGGI